MDLACLLEFCSCRKDPQFLIELRTGRRDFGRNLGLRRQMEEDVVSSEIEKKYNFGLIYLTPKNIRKVRRERRRGLFGVFWPLAYFVIAPGRTESGGELYQVQSRLV